MSKAASVGGWLRGTTIRKSATSSAHGTRPTTPQIQSTSSTIFGGGVKDATGKVTEFASQADQCPVCKSDRYLNPKLRLLVSACYHKMCESCIDRLFTLGPAPCPICGKVLRKLAFMPQTFEDLTVEKEVAVRRRLAKDFNKRREDFPDLHTYNDYLEEVEDITFNLINDIDVTATEARVQQFRKENASLIEANIQRDESYATQLRKQEESERSQREERARELAREEEEEREARETERRELIDRLETSDKDAFKLVKKARMEVAKRHQAKEAGRATRSTAKLLQSRAALSVVPDVPHVPLQDDYDDYRTLFNVRSPFGEGYVDPSSAAVRQDRDGIMRAGGYFVEQAWERAIRCAVAGLDVPPLGSEVEPSSVMHALGSDMDIVMQAA